MPTARSARSLRLAVVVTAAALALSGCSASASGEEKATTSGATVHTIYGEVTVPAHPKRIVALDFPEATALADLGIKPVAIGSYTPDFPAYTKFFTGVPVVADDPNKPDLEKIAALKPDLIVTDDFVANATKDRPTYRQLSSIAPTVVLEWTTAGGNWRADAAGTAQAVGRTSQMDALERAYEQHAASIKKTYAEVLSTTTFDIVSASADNWYLYDATSSHGRVLVDAGARLNAAKDLKAGYTEESFERFGILKDTGAIVYDDADGAGGAALLKQPLFAAQPAVKAGKAYPTSRFFPSSYAIANALLDDFEAALKKLR